MTELFKTRLELSNGLTALSIAEDGTEIVLPLLDIIEYFEKNKKIETEPMTLQAYLAFCSMDTVIKMN